MSDATIEEDTSQQGKVFSSAEKERENAILQNIKHFSIV